jgi:hypothetical protein
VKTTGQAEVPLQISARLPEKIENTIGLRGHKRLLYH